LMPVTFFLVFNNQAVCFCIYRTIENLLDAVLFLLCKKCINKDFYIAQMHTLQQTVSQDQNKQPRALARLEKKQKKNT